ncbi:uncharacterized protein ColSpa_02483 [Colletotrichum spaethianum]|uniref:Uncharacterized protein n=1 Tax=Colletotrichum spaethianum TaxID=700344 RepID=A0AA37L5N0_9PEZI|nr:uncharacterized protein ColSpa_02483 [Colletotrichum spaethianum]GKT42302.1 hypothetical protein ColSpa_02483 [Colletotrichum spaethianum]
MARYTNTRTKYVQVLVAQQPGPRGYEGPCIRMREYTADGRSYIGSLKKQNWVDQQTKQKSRSSRSRLGVDEFEKHLDQQEIAEIHQDVTRFVILPTSSNPEAGFVGHVGYSSTPAIRNSRWLCDYILEELYSNLHAWLLDHVGSDIRVD